MAASDSTVRIVDNAVKHRFETEVEGHRALLVYRHDGERLVLVHTEVPSDLGGRGIGGQLVEAAIAGDVRIVPECSFARSWLTKHPELAARARVDWPKE